MQILYLNRCSKHNDFKAVLDKVPELTFEKVGFGSFVGTYEQDGEVVFSWFLNKGQFKGAFGGRELKLKMKDGTVKTIKDYWYDGGSYHKDIEMIGIGVGTVKDLKKCYVYTHININKKFFYGLVEKYLTKNKLYDYYEIKKLLFQKDIWYPVKFYNREIPFMINKNGDIVEKWTKEKVYAKHNITKKVNGEYREYNFFKLKYTDETGRLVKIETTYNKVLKDSVK